MGHLRAQRDAHPDPALPAEPNETHTRIPLYQRARGFGFPGVRVDGNDVVAVYAVAKAALEHARSGQGPFLIEAYTYRMGAHTTSDDPTKYRDSAEVDLWRDRDPIERVKTHLLWRGHTDPEFFDGVDREADELAARIRKGVQDMPDPDVDVMFDHVYAEPHPFYAEPHPGLAEEKAELHAYEAGFEGAEGAGR